MKTRAHMQFSADAAGAARLVFGSRARMLKRCLKEVAEPRAGAKARRAVHQVRVATRRFAVALDVFEPVLPGKGTRAAGKAVRDVRRLCGELRDADVLRAWLKAELRSPSAPLRPGLEFLDKLLRAQRREARAKLARKLPAIRAKVEDKFARVLGSRTGEAHASTVGQSARTALERLADEVLVAAAANLRNTERLHALRIACKRLRYGLELFEPCLGKKQTQPLLAQLEEFQAKVGGFTDASMRCELIQSTIKVGAVPKANTSKSASKPPSRPLASLRRLLVREQATLKREQRASIQGWRSLASSNFLDALRELTFTPTPDSRAAPAAAASPARTSTPAGYDETIGDAPALPRTPRILLVPSNGHTQATRVTATSRKQRRRIAAIDVGTNSIRLIIAETAPDGSYRVLDDEKEITRLGRGLHSTGKLDPATQEHSAVTISQMISIAAGYGADSIRVVATSACREATNAADFLALVKERAGVDVEVIPAEQEALLAYRSAAGAFDLAGVPAAVVDIGGGSLEVVFSAGPGAEDARGAGLGGGVIERIFSLPLGAVRLTEQFGGADAAVGKGFRDLTRFIESQLKETIGKPPFTPRILVGTGGTFSALGAMLAHREQDGAAGGLFPGTLQGREVRRADLRHLLEYLRKLSVKERAKVHGLPADRADIIVAGLAVIDRLLGFLGCNGLFVHEGGIRDGLLLSMVRGGAGDSSPRHGGPMRAVKRFARACGFEAAHASHVTRLALRVFDELAAQSGSLRPRKSGWGTSFDARDRLLLEAASLLHDVGYLVNYAAHHKHSYHLIVHADLPGFTSREVQVIANVARYHRAAEPKLGHRNFAALTRDDQQRVRALAGVLRLADGLDRTHMQQVLDLRVRIEKGGAHFELVADSKPAVDIWGAVRKSQLFTRVFGVLPHFECRIDELLVTEAGRVAPIQADLLSA